MRELEKKRLRVKFTKSEKYACVKFFTAQLLLGVANTILANRGLIYIRSKPFTVDLKKV